RTPGGPMILAHHLLVLTLLILAPIAAAAQTPAAPAPAPAAAETPASPAPGPADAQTPPAPPPAPAAAQTPANAPPAAAAIEKGSTVQIEYTLKDDAGTLLDSNKGQAPLTYTQGDEQLIPAVERELAGMHAGEEKKIVVKPEDAYGPS